MVKKELTMITPSYTNTVQWSCHEASTDVYDRKLRF